MNSQPEWTQELIWATRGRSWGFRFLLSAGLADPLREYERMFGRLGDEPQGLHRSDGKVALRFPDPMTRRDESGRVIPHEFVVFGNEASTINAVEDGLERIWPRVEAAYAHVWSAEEPPSVAELRFTDSDEPLDQG